MAVEAVINVETRKEAGTAPARRLRHTGWIPAIVTNQDRTTTPVKLKAHTFEMMLARHQSENMVLDISLDGAAPAKALLQDVQHDSLTGAVLHADFTMISMTETLVVDVTLVLKGDPVGVLQQDGILEHLVHELEVEGLAADIVDTLEVDVSSLHVGESIRAGDVPMPSGLTLVTNADLAVVTVLVPRLETVKAETAEATAPVAEAGATPAPQS
jgi:large subunit ribosomal protein L25